MSLDEEQFGRLTIGDDSSSSEDERQPDHPAPSTSGRQLDDPRAEPRDTGNQPEPPFKVDHEGLCQCEHPLLFTPPLLPSPPPPFATAPTGSDDSVSASPLPPALPALEGDRSRASSLGFREDMFAYIDDHNGTEADEDALARTANTQETVVTEDIEGGGDQQQTEPNTENECPEMNSEGRVSELEYNFLDESDRSECTHSDSAAIIRKPEMASADTPAHSPKSEGSRPYHKSRAPPPPDDGCRARSYSDAICTGSHMHRPACPSAMVKYHYNHPHKIRFLQLSYNTNLRKPPENWLRMKQRHHSDRTRHDFGSSFWTHPFSKGSSWSILSNFRLGTSLYGRRGRYQERYGHQADHFSSGHGYYLHRDRHRHLTMNNFDRSQCLCCDCCNCSQTNQTCCCCCYHCVHTTSSCRRSDLLRLVPVPGATPPSILKKPKKQKQSRKRVAPGPGEPQPIKADGEDAAEKLAEKLVEKLEVGPRPQIHMADSGDEPASSGGEQKQPIKERGV